MATRKSIAAGTLQRPYAVREPDLALTANLYLMVRTVWRSPHADTVDPS